MRHGDSESCFRLLVEHARDLLCVHEPNGRYVYVSPSVRDILGYEPADLVGRDPYALVHPDDVEQARSEAESVARAAARRTSVTCRMRSASGGWVWLEMVVEPVMDDAGRVVQLLTASRDVTARRRIEAALRASEELHRRLVEMSPEGIAVHRDGRLVFVNQALMSLLGYERPEELLGRPILDLVDASYHSTVRERLRQIEHGGAAPLMEEQLVRRDGSRVEVEIVAVPIVFDGRPAVQAVVRDVSARVALESRLREESVRDPLTGCYNRRYLEELEIDLAERVRGRWGCVYIDVDRFKRYNDVYGHQAGDQVLVQLSHFLMRQVRPDEAVVRVGGDEFVVVLSDVDAEQVRAIAERLRASAYRGEAPVPFSLGWAARAHGEPLASTIARADRELMLVRVGARAAGRHADQRAAEGPSPESNRGGL